MLKFVAAWLILLRELEPEWCHLMSAEGQFPFKCTKFPYQSFPQSHKAQLRLASGCLGYSWRLLRNHRWFWYHPRTGLHSPPDLLNLCRKKCHAVDNLSVYNWWPMREQGAAGGKVVVGGGGGGPTVPQPDGQYPQLPCPPMWTPLLSVRVEHPYRVLQVCWDLLLGVILRQFLVILKSNFKQVITQI